MIRRGANRSFRDQVNRQNEEWLDEESEKLDAYADDLEKQLRLR